MKRSQILFTAVVVAGLTAFAARADTMGSGSMMMSSAKPAIYTPSTIKWMAGTGQFKGLTMAVLSGDPTKSGAWTVRLKIPAGTKFPVHYHNDTEMVTVISGTFMAALGDKYDASKLMALPAGSFVVIPAGIKHYAAANVDTVLQLSGSKPFGMMTDKGSM